MPFGGEVYILLCLQVLILDDGNKNFNFYEMSEIKDKILQITSNLF